MNNNRNNNRRRGRGNNRQQGGGQQLNRIDSRARGNAPQLLEKYKKLAHDAHLNGDRVQAEYYLQFADHYFRVLADARLRQEEQRTRRDERYEGQPGSFDEGDDGEFGDGSEMSGFDQPYRRDERSDYGQREGGQRENGQRDNDRGARENGREYRGRDGQRDGGQREGGQRDGGQRDNDRGPRRERYEGNRQRDEAPAVEQAQPDNPDAGETSNEFEPAGGNPFTRGNRMARGLKPRRERESPGGFEGETGDESGGLDPSLLPPAISEARDAAPATEEAPAPRKRGRPRKVVAEDGGADSLETVSG